MADAPKLPDVPLWQSAASFAARVHQHQTRRDGKTPYVAHVFRVALTVRDVFGCDDQVCLAAALLHDTIEDTGTDFDEIAEAFGDEVARCVAALTKNMALPEQEREAEYDTRLARADWRARLVKLADQYDNLCDLCGGDTKFCARATARAKRALKLAETDRDVEVVARAAAIVRERLNTVGG
jgi:guanosine-3',5'-bis(diphosphate) 3'-pyrophosphohydrolase